MKARVTDPNGFKIFIQGTTYTYKKGEVLEDWLAAKAVKAGKAQKLPTKKTKSMKAAPENK